MPVSGPGCQTPRRKPPCDNVCLAWWVWLILILGFAVLLGVCIFAAVCANNAKKDIRKLLDDNHDKDWKDKSWKGSYGDHHSGGSGDGECPDCNCGDCNCRCEEQNCIVDKHNCTCPNLERAQDAFDDWLINDNIRRLGRLIDFERFWMKVKAPHFPFGGEFHGPKGFREFLRKLFSSLELKSVKSLGQWSLSDCSCRFIKLRFELRVKPKCPLRKKHYGGKSVIPNNAEIISEKDGDYYHEKDFELHFQFDIRFDHYDRINGFDLFFDSATVLKEIRRKCRYEHYGDGWDWYDYDHDHDWTEWKDYHLPYPEESATPTPAPGPKSHGPPSHGPPSQKG